MLLGFGPVPDIVALIQHHVPPTVPVETTRQRVAWEHPLVVILMILGALVVVEAVRRVGGPMVFDTIYYAILLVVGVWWLAYGPLSRPNPHLRKWEVVGGVVMIVCGLGLLVLRAF